MSFPAPGHAVLTRIMNSLHQSDFFQESIYVDLRTHPWLILAHGLWGENLMALSNN